MPKSTASTPTATAPKIRSLTPWVKAQSLESKYMPSPATSGDDSTGDYLGNENLAEFLNLELGGVCDRCRKGRSTVLGDAFGVKNLKRIKVCRYQRSVAEL